MTQEAKKLICIECPNGCALSVEIEAKKVTKVDGNKCPKGEDYAKSEIENPVRILTTSVLAQGLPLKVISVRTNGPIAKSKLFDAMKKVKTLRITDPVNVGDVVAKNFLGLGVNLVATKACSEKKIS